MSGPGDRVFVYGTLRPGEERWPLVEDAVVRTEPAEVRGAQWDTGQGYPAAVFGANGTIPGDVLRIAPERWSEVIDWLDRIEGEGTLYRRVVVETPVGPAVSYEWMGATDGFAPLPHGWPPAT